MLSFFTRNHHLQVNLIAQEISRRVESNSYYDTKHSVTIYMLQVDFELLHVLQLWLWWGTETLIIVLFLLISHNQSIHREAVCASRKWGLLSKYRQLRFPIICRSQCWRRGSLLRTSSTSSCVQSGGYSWKAALAAIYGSQKSSCELRNDDA